MFALEHSFKPLKEILLISFGAASQEGEHRLNILLSESSALCEVTTFVFAAFPQKRMHTTNPKPIELIDRAQHRESPTRVRLTTKSDRLQHAIKNLSIIHLHNITSARNAQRLHRVRSHHAHLGIGSHRARADRIRIELHELPEP